MANEKVNKVVLGNETLIDLTNDTVNANNLLAGETAHDRSGNQVQGNVAVPTNLDDLSDVSASSPSNGDLLFNNGTSWINKSADSITHTFTESATRTNVASGDSNATLWGKVKKWFSDLTNGVFTSTTKAVDLQNWSTDTTSQSGVTLYKKAVSLSHVYVDEPSIDIGAGTGYVLPTTAEQTAYDLIQYATCDDTVPCLYLYASAIPTTAFYIKVTGVD